MDLPLDVALAVLARLPLDDAASCAKAAMTCRDAYAQWRARELAALPAWTVKPMIDDATHETVLFLRLDADPVASMRLVRALVVHGVTPERLWSLLGGDASSTCVARHVTVTLRVNRAQFDPFRLRLRSSGVLTRWKACLVGCQAAPDPEGPCVAMNVVFEDPPPDRLGAWFGRMSWSNFCSDNP